MHCGVEVTESSTNKQHHLSQPGLRIPAAQPLRGCAVRHLVAGPTHALVGCVAAGPDGHTLEVQCLIFWTGYH